MKSIYIILLLLPVMLSTNCRKQHPTACDDKNTIKVAQHAKDYFYFKQGSWWVYEEETSGVLDSIWVESSSEKIFVPEGGIQRSCNCGWGKCVEELTVRFVNNIHNQSNKSDLYIYSINAGLVKEGTTITSSGGAYFSISPTRVAYNKDGNIITPLPIEASMQILDSMEVKGKNYKDILHIYYTEDKGIGDWLQEGFYAKGIHLVKYTRHDSTTWNLIKYNIVK